MGETTIGSIKAKLVLDSKGFHDNMNKARDDMQKSSKSSQNLSRDMGRIQAASLAVGGAVVAGIGASVSVAANFEQSMARVGAVSNSTGEDFELLRETAKRLGAETQFSASQAAEGMSYLAMAGFEVSEIVGAMPSVLNLAAAAQIDLGRSADIVSNIMTGFGLTADDTGHAVDVLVKTMTTANTDLPMLGDAMKYVSPVAVSLGLSMEETAAAVGKMSDAGIQGSQAGTALRAMLLSLANPTGQTVKAMDALGIKVTDANGAMKPLPELIGHISDKLGGMEDAQKTATAAQLVGTEAASGLLAIMSVGEDGLREYTKELENAGGTAERVAKTQMDTLKGSFTEFQSALEGLGISIGEEFLPQFTEIVRGGTDIVRMLGELNPGIATTGIKMVGTAAGIALVASTAVKLIATMKTLALSLGPAGWLIAGLSILGGLIVGVRDEYTRMNEVNLETINTMQAEADTLSANIDEYDNYKLRLRLTSDELERFVDINSILAQTADPEVIAALSDEQAELLEKSGLTNDEQRFVDLNGEIASVVPDSNVHLTEQGNILLNNTAAARDLNKEQYEKIRLELEAQQILLEANHAGELQKQKDLQQDINNIQEKRNEIEKNIAIAEQVVIDKTKELAKAKEEGNQSVINHLSQELHFAEDIVQGLKEQNAKQMEKYLTKKDELDLINEELAKMDEVRRKLIDLELKQAGITAEKGEGIKAIDTEIDRLKKQKIQMEFSTKEAMKQTDEYKDGIKQIDGQISKLETTRSKVSGIISEARNMNAELGKAINKRVNITQYTNTGASISQYHTGGIVGRGQLPKLHTGGLASQLQSAPLHNEVDARLLKNEMVLTEAQQANLMRMIDAGHTQGSGVSSDLASKIERLVSAIGSSQDRPITVKLEADGRELAEVTYPHIDTKLAGGIKSTNRINGIR